MTAPIALSDAELAAYLLKAESAYRASWSEEWRDVLREAARRLQTSPRPAAEVRERVAENTYVGGGGSGRLAQPDARKAALEEVLRVIEEERSPTPGAIGAIINGPLDRIALHCRHLSQQRPERE